MLTRHDKVNDIVREYKEGKINVNLCIKDLAQMFKPMYLNRYKSLSHMIHVDTSHTWMPDLETVFFDALECSLRNFSFESSYAGKNTLSFVPYFQTLFSQRSGQYAQLLYKEAKKAQSKESLDAILSHDKPSRVSFEEKYASISFDKCSDLKQRNLEKYLKKNLTKREYKIFYLKLKDRSNHYIAFHMRTPCSHEKIRREWIAIIEKLKILLKKRVGKRIVNHYIQQNSLTSK